MQQRIMNRWSSILVGLLMFGLPGCESSQPTTPEASVTEVPHVLAPAGPVAEMPPVEPGIAQRVQLAIPLESPHQENFTAAPGYSDQIGVYYDGRSDFFQVQVPPGEYLLTYTTDLGHFYLVFAATENALLTIWLMGNDVVYEAMLYRGTVTDKSSAFYADPVIVYSQFGARDNWWTIFAKDDSPGIIVIGWVRILYDPGTSLTLILPKPATYVLDYQTTLGHFRTEFRASSVQQEWVIFLQPGDLILEAYLTVYD